MMFSIIISTYASFLLQLPLCHRCVRWTGTYTYCSRIHAHILMMKYQLNILQAGHLCHVTIFIIVEVSTLIRSYPDRLWCFLHSRTAFGNFPFRCSRYRNWISDIWQNRRQVVLRLSFFLKPSEDMLIFLLLVWSFWYGSFRLYCRCLKPLDKSRCFTAWLEFNKLIWSTKTFLFSDIRSLNLCFLSWNKNLNSFSWDR